MKKNTSKLMVKIYADQGKYLKRKSDGLCVSSAALPIGCIDVWEEMAGNIPESIEVAKDNTEIVELKSQIATLQQENIALKSELSIAVKPSVLFTK